MKFNEIDDDSFRYWTKVVEGEFKKESAKIETEVGDDFRKRYGDGSQYQGTEEEKRRAREAVERDRKQEIETQTKEARDKRLLESFSSIEDFSVEKYEQRKKMLELEEQRKEEEEISKRNKEEKAQQKENEKSEANRQQKVEEKQRVAAQQKQETADRVKTEEQSKTELGKNTDQQKVEVKKEVAGLKQTKEQKMAAYEERMREHFARINKAREQDKDLGRE